MPSTKLRLGVLKNPKAQPDRLMYQAYEILRVGHFLYNNNYEMQKLKPKKKNFTSKQCDDGEILSEDFATSRRMKYTSRCRFS